MLSSVSKREIPIIQPHDLYKFPSKMTQFTIRTMSEMDMNSVMSIQAMCYSGDIPESQNSLRAKLVASPDTCWVAEHNGLVHAYLFSLPWLSSAPPALNAISCMLPAQPNCLYLHDLSVAPALRGTGVGAALVAQFFTMRERLRMPCACLVAVQNSVSYWRRFGFEVVDSNLVLAEKLQSYGADARFMQLQAE